MMPKTTTAKKSSELQFRGPKRPLGERGQRKWPYWFKLTGSSSKATFLQPLWAERACWALRQVGYSITLGFTSVSRKQESEATSGHGFTETGQSEVGKHPQIFFQSWQHVWMESEAWFRYKATCWHFSMQPGWDERWDMISALVISERICCAWGSSVSLRPRRPCADAEPSTAERQRCLTRTLLSCHVSCTLTDGEKLETAWDSSGVFCLSHIHPA